MLNNYQPLAILPNATRLLYLFSYTSLSGTTTKTHFTPDFTKETLEKSRQFDTLLCAKALLLYNLLSLLLIRQNKTHLTSNSTPCQSNFNWIKQHTQNQSLYTIIDKIPYIISQFRNIAKQETSHLLASIGVYGLYGQDLLQFVDVISFCLCKGTRVLELFVLGTSTFSKRDKCGGAPRRLLHFTILEVLSQRCT